MHSPQTVRRNNTYFHGQLTLLDDDLQVEGAFVMGMGLQCQEEVVVDEVTGHLISDSTWNYKIPTAACIPRRLNVTFLEVRCYYWLSQPTDDDGICCVSCMLTVINISAPVATTFPS